MGMSDNQDRLTHAGDTHITLTNDPLRRSRSAVSSNDAVEDDSSDS